MPGRLLIPTLTISTAAIGFAIGFFLLTVGQQPEAAPIVVAVTDPTAKQPARDVAAPKDDAHRVRAPDSTKLSLELKLPTREKAALEALAVYFRTSLFAKPAKKLDVIGFARRGARVPVKRSVSGEGCRKGRWYLVQGGGYVCTSRGFVVGKKPRMHLAFALPRLDRLLPHPYGKVIRDGAERLFRIPTIAEDKLIAKAADKNHRLPDVVEKEMRGIYFVAVGKTTTSKGRAFHRTVRGRYVRKEDVDLRSTPPMRGEWLGDKQKLPLAFVFDQDRPLYRPSSGNQLHAVGVIEKHARFRPAGTIKRGQRTLLRTGSGLLVDRQHVRLIRKIQRPTDIPARDKWIHVDLAQQSLVAYEDDTPVFATLVSSGKKGFEPPMGTFRIHRKYISTTMNGPDPDKDWYEVEEVPWTMYYWESYALHGTYWHNDFGKPRSHGCTNLAPADAKWLFYWADPELPYAWHAREKRGTRVYFTNRS